MQISFHMGCDACVTSTMMSDSDSDGLHLNKEQSPSAGVTIRSTDITEMIIMNTYWTKCQTVVKPTQ